MEIKFYSDKTINELIQIDLEALPYTYLPSYKNFTKTNYNFEIFVALEPKENIFVIFSRNKTKFITNIQILSEPFKGKELLKADEQRNFFKLLQTEMIKQKIGDRIITPQNFIVFSNTPTNSKHCEFGSYRVNLTPNEDELYAKVHPKHRNKISKAQRSGVEIKTGKTELNTFYQLYSQTMKRSNMYCEPFSFFENLYTTLDDKNCICTVVYHNNEPQGAILAPFTKYCCYYVYGASADQITESGSINYLHWQTMLLLKQKGVRAYDFVGARLSDVSNTKLEGIQSFKERFGGELRKGFLFKQDLNKTKCSLFDIMLETKNKLRGQKQFKDIIDQEIEKQSA